jgi:hypothetical protein
MFAGGSDLTTTVGQIAGGAVVIGGVAYGVIRKWLSDRRNDSVADAKASADQASFDVYDRTIGMLRKDIDTIRADKEAADQKWRADMATLEQRLRDVGAQADAAVDRAWKAQAIIDKLRAQLRAANMEPCA